jgi:hypothetical protein
MEIFVQECCRLKEPVAVSAWVAWVGGGLVYMRFTSFLPKGLVIAVTLVGLLAACGGKEFVRD